MSKKYPNVLTYKGVTKTFSEWGKEKNLKPDCIRGRVLGGWTVEATLETPVRVKSGKAKKYKGLPTMVKIRNEMGPL